MKKLSKGLCFKVNNLRKKEIPIIVGKNSKKHSKNTIKQSLLLFLKILPIQDINKENPFLYTNKA